MKRLFSLLTCVLLVAGCGTKPGPAVSLVNVHLTDMTAFETTATFTLRFSNEQPEPMELTGGAHKIYINGLYVGRGLTSDPLVLPRLATATQDVVVHLNNIALATRLKPLIESKSFDYRIKSTLYGKTSGRMGSESEGKLDLKDFTPAETNSVSATNSIQ